MKSWTVAELNNVVHALEPLVGSRLQEVETAADDVVLGFYSARGEGMLWLWIDLNAIHPCLLPWGELPNQMAARALHQSRAGGAKKSPLNLFLRAHFVGQILKEIERPDELGRVVHLRFGERHLELRLFPHGRNFLASAQGKRIAWQKPHALEQMGPPSPPPEAGRRSLEQLRDEWLAHRQAKNATPSTKSRQKLAATPRQRLQNEIDKKLKAQEKVKSELQLKQQAPWRAIGDWLKTNQSVAVPKEWEPLIDKRRKLSWNIEQCFTKARETDNKIAGTKTRLAILQNEIDQVRLRLEQNDSTIAVTDQKPAFNPLARQPDTHGRTLRLTENLTVIAGKSALDNMKILRKARSWDLWFHLRDVPSSHAVLFRDKKQKVNDQLLHEVAAWFVRLQLGAKFRQHRGDKFDIVIAECRHVRPIKGDKLGRVTYHEERVITYQLPS